MLREVKCARPRDQLIAPAWSGDAGEKEVRNLWHCANCGYMFESVDIELTEEFLPDLVIA
jgi:hypothetical protein